MATRKKFESPQWGTITKVIVVLVCLSILGFLAWRFSGLVGQFVVAAMLAYIVNPAVDLLHTRGRFSRGWAVMVVFLSLIIIVVGFATLIGVAVSTQVSSLIERLPKVIDDLVGFFRQMRTNTDSIVILGMHFTLAEVPWDDIQAQVNSGIMSLMPQSATAAFAVAGESVNVLGWVTITLLLAIYVAIDLPRLGVQLMGIAEQSGYRSDAHRLMRSFNRIWDAYLRGQLILGIIIAVITSAMLAALGVENWLALGLLSGVLQVIPYVGPTVSAVLIVLFALFQPANYMGLSPGIYALVVGAVTLVVQQVAGNVLLPTVVGDALNMSALAVLVSLIFGFAVASVMGAILAAPVVASLRLLVTYIWHKLLDLPPFSDEEDRPPTQVTMIVQRSKKLIEQIRNRGESSSTETS